MVREVTPQQSYKVFAQFNLGWPMVLSALGFPNTVIDHVCQQDITGPEVFVPFAPALPLTSEGCRHVESLGLVIVSSTWFVATLFPYSALLLATLAMLATSYSVVA